MFSVVTKLKQLKKPLRKLNKDNGNVFDKVKVLKSELERVQVDMEKNPFNKDLRDEECIYLKAYNDAVMDEELFLKQKSKAFWFSVGDFNTSYFHKAINGRLNRSRIDAIL